MHRRSTIVLILESIGGTGSFPLPVAAQYFSNTREEHKIAFVVCAMVSGGGLVSSIKTSILSSFMDEIRLISSLH